MSKPLSLKIASLIALLPDKPGVYEMKDIEGKIIYIGKAKNLKKRVSQYFLREQEGKVLAMVSHVDSFDFIVVNSEKEAFILEMNLIQTYYPRYNIMLTDDSHYPYIALHKKDASLSIARKASDKTHHFYFGPFPNSRDAYQTIRLLERIYPTKKCHGMPAKACLYMHMGQCLAPCVNKNLKIDDFQRLYEQIKRFLDGQTDEILALLKQRMLKASEEMRYEDADEIKKTIESIEKTVAKQNVEILSDRSDRDVFAYSSRDGYLALTILTCRGGRLLGKKAQVVPLIDEEGEEVTELIAQYYQKEELPKEIICKIPSFQETFLAIYPEAKIREPKEGRLLELLEIASLNAKEALDAHFLSARLEDDNLSLLEELGKLLSIKTPYRIELFDNSHLQGSSPVGAMVCYINGAPAKKMYRKYHLATKNGGDDYHSMVEVTSRRYRRLKEEGLSFPDLILTDGGYPQVEAALEGLKAVGVTIPVYGLYKNDKHQTEGIVGPHMEKYPLSISSPLFFLLMRMQDEVHRYAISFHKASRLKAMHASIFDGIEGIGEKRKEIINRNYPTLDALKKASLSELEQLLPVEVAKGLYEKVKNLK